MKRKLIAFLLAGAMLASMCVFSGCDVLAPYGGPTATQPEPGSNQGSEDSQPSGSGEGPVVVINWEKDDDYHWEEGGEKHLHTVEDGVCTACGKEVNHTVGLEYELIKPEATIARLAASEDLDYDLSEGYYVVTGIGSATDSETVIIPSTYNGIPVKVIGEHAFANLSKVAAMHTLVIPSSIISMSYSSFSSSGITKILYEGDEPAWETLKGDNEYTSFIDKNTVEVWQTSPVVYFYTEQTNETGRYWRYDSNGNVETYKNWVGLAGTYPLNVVGLTPLYFWQLEAINIECDIISADGDDFSYDLYAVTSSSNDGGVTWQENRVKLDLTRTPTVDNLQGSFYSMLYEVPADFPNSGGGAMGVGWTFLEENTFGLLFDYAETKMTDGRFSVTVSVHFMPKNNTEYLNAYENGKECLFNFSVY